MRDVPSPGPPCRNALFQAGQKQPQDSPKVLSQPLLVPNQLDPWTGSHSSRGCSFLPAAALAQRWCSQSGHLPWDGCPSPGQALLLLRQPLAPLQGLLPVAFFLASVGRRKTSGFLILDGSEQRQLNADHPSSPAAVPSLWAAASAQGRGRRISPKAAGGWTHWLSVTGFMSSGRTLKKLTTCRHREILWGRLTSM